jgi:hypothetical protein
MDCTCGCAERAEAALMEMQKMADAITAALRKQSEQMSQHYSLLVSLNGNELEGSRPQGGH